jgi:hypothetical protein
MSETHTKRYEDPLERKKTGDSVRGLHRSEETIEKMRQPKSETHKQHISEAMKNHPVSSETRDKISESRDGKYGLENHPNWQGGKSFEPYCKKFNESFRERVRAFFDYTCQLCGDKQDATPTKLHVHHIAYNKQTCCDNSPHMFVPLCQRCHLKTNANRLEYETLFTKLITEKYHGRSYFTMEEWDKAHGKSPQSLSSQNSI